MARPPDTDWLAATVALDDDGFVLAGQRAGVEGILETSVPGVFAVAHRLTDPSEHRVVRFVHERFSADVLEAPAASGG